MAYIQPTGTIEFFGDLGLSPNYDDTFYFDTTAHKDDYFTNTTKLATALNCTYTREKRGYVRVQIPMSTLIYAQYMRFYNNGFEGKWWYAFVKSVNYINNNTTEVEFQIDFLMSWMGSFTLGHCMVEREHTLYDDIGEHLMDEGLSTGDYILAAAEQITPYAPYLLVSSSSSVVTDAGGNKKVEDADACMYCGYMLTGLRYHPFQMHGNDSEDAFNAWLAEITKATKADSIVSMRIVPQYCVPLGTLTGSAAGLAQENQGTFTSAATITSIDGYTPRNNKIFSYPYIVYEVVNGEGSANEYRLELFDTPLVASFKYFGIAFDNVEVILYPYGYKNYGVNPVFDEAMIMRQFPQAAFSIDQYKAWVAQMTAGGGWISEVGRAAETIGSAIGGASRADAIGSIAGGAAAALSPLNAGASIAGGVASLASQALDLLSEKVKYQAAPNAVRGTNNANIMSALGQKRFNGYLKTIKAEYAIAIDRYFDMYGYKISTMKHPSMCNRPQWTFTKTQGCIVHGSLPADDAAAIENVFNKGCRFWNVYGTNLTIGDYTGPNSAATRS